jgi:hypothetical protein
MIPFTTCLGQSYLIQKKLCAALLANEELAEYADDVKILSTAESAASDRRYHVVVALLFEAFCIVVDYNLHSTAILIPLGGKVETEERILLNDRRGTAVYRYTYDQTGRDGNDQAGFSSRLD